MEWVETTAKTLDEAREAALDQLGVGLDDAEFDILEEPKPGLFGRMRGEARLRARVRPTQARPKQERRRKGRGDKPATDTAEQTPRAPKPRGDKSLDQKSVDRQEPDRQAPGRQAPARKAPARKSTARTSPARTSPARTSTEEAPTMEESLTDNDATGMGSNLNVSEVTPDEVGAAAITFMDGLTEAFGMEATSELSIDGTVLELNVAGAELGLLVGPGGRTLNAVQDLARVAAQRRLGDHETRLRIDVAGYRARREQALVAFSMQVAEQVRSSGVARSLEPMMSSDRKVIHDVLNDQDGVASRSVGEDPTRRIIVEPA
jgi:spoIIIJ-associated protein